ncbi:DUF4352 domain-containing protein [Nonomuraea sp. NPDC059194]|uniref:DUF4352 domain-containing protein n=1 Tax=Nonomuraea sp. NPDC059194 TaxID=3346764 RepID=UPI00368CA355
MRRPILIACALVALTSCSSAPAPERAQARPTYDLPARPVRVNEVPIHAAPVTDGDARFQVIGLQTGQASLSGSHAEWPAKGQFITVRVVVENPGRSTSRFDARRQRLVIADGRTFPISDTAQITKRQPVEIPVGAGVRLEMDLWFDIPKDARPTAIKLYGDPPIGYPGTDGAQVSLK